MTGEEQLSVGEDAGVSRPAWEKSVVIAGSAVAGDCRLRVPLNFGRNEPYSMAAVESERSKLSLSSYIERFEVDEPNPPANSGDRVLWQQKMYSLNSLICSLRLVSVVIVCRDPPQS